MFLKIFCINYSSEGIDVQVQFAQFFQSDESSGSQWSKRVATQIKDFEVGMRHQISVVQGLEVI